MICEVCWDFFIFFSKKNEIGSNVFLEKGKLNDIWNLEPT
jgi:hypothetical protein